MHRDRSDRTSGRHTTHLQDLPAEVTVVRKRHPFCGRSLVVFGWMRRQGRLDLILVLPDGSRSLIPAAWTDFGGDDRTGSSSEVLGSLGDLQRLRVVTDGLIHRSRDAKGENGRCDQGEVGRAASIGRGGRDRDSRGVGSASRRGAGGGDRTSGRGDDQSGRSSRRRRSGR